MRAKLRPPAHRALSKLFAARTLWLIVGHAWRLAATRADTHSVGAHDADIELEPHSRAAWGLAPKIIGGWAEPAAIDAGVWSGVGRWPPERISPLSSENPPKAPRRLGPFPGIIDPRRYPTAARTMRTIYLGQQFRGVRLNTGTMTDIQALAAALLANFWTIDFQPSEECFPRSATHWDWWQAAKARRADRQRVNDYRQRLRQELIAHGHDQFLDHVEPDPDGGWRLHLFVADDAAMLLLDTQGRCGAGDPASFNPEEFVQEQLEDGALHPSLSAMTVANAGEFIGYSLMTEHPFPLGADMATDIILYPTSDELRKSTDPLVFAKAQRCVNLYFSLLQAILAKHGHLITLDCIEHEQTVGWLIHYRTDDPLTITMLHDIAAGDPAPSDPVELNLFVTQVLVGDSLSA